MIKNYLQLNDVEIQHAYAFYTRNELEKSDFKSFENKMTSSLYDYGNGSIFYIHNNKILAKAQIILKDIAQTAKSYIVNLDIIEVNKLNAHIIIDLVSKAHEISRKYNAREIYFRTNSEDIVGLLQNYNIRHEHLTLVMKLKDKKKITSTLNVIPLSYTNKDYYKIIFDEIFIDSPNAQLIDESKLESSIKNNNSDVKYYIVNDEDNNNIGILETKITNRIATFNIGILNKYRNNGYGKKLLDTAILLLKNNSHVNEINVLVNSKNTMAYDMLMNRGFVHKQIYSFWYGTKSFIECAQDNTLWQDDSESQIV